MDEEQRARIRANVLAERNAKDSIALLQNDVVDDIMTRSRFWKIVAEEAAEKAGLEVVDPLEKKDGPQPMDENEAKKFEQKQIPFGRWEGSFVYEVDPEYWCNVLDNQFSRDMRRYVMSSRFQRILDRE